MGSYSSFRIAGRELYSVKNDIDPLLMSLFRPEDKIVEPGTYVPGEAMPNQSRNLLTLRIS